MPDQTTDPPYRYFNSLCVLSLVAGSNRRLPFRRGTGVQPEVRPIEGRRSLPSHRVSVLSIGCIAGEGAPPPFAAIAAHNFLHEIASGARRGKVRISGIQEPPPALWRLSGLALRPPGRASPLWNRTQQPNRRFRADPLPHRP